MAGSEPYDIDRISEVLAASELARRETVRRLRFLVRELDSVIGEYAKVATDWSEQGSGDAQSEVEYVAIDGTRDIIEGHTHARVFAGGFAIHGSTGNVGVSEIDKKCAYSVVSLPYKVLTPTNEYLVESTMEITNLVMLLSELYIATLFASRTHPKILLLDRPLCGTMAHTARDVKQGSPLKDAGALEISEKTPSKTLGPGLKILEEVCNRLFVEANPEPLKLSGHYLSSEDLMYLCRVGLEHLLELCRQKGILLVGLIKSTSDTSFIRLLLSLCVRRGLDVSSLVRIQEVADDVRLLETWLEPYGDLMTTVEYDTALMTQFLDQHGNLKSSMGYAPPGRFLRSYLNFGRLEEGGFVFGLERALAPNEAPPSTPLAKDLDILLYPKDDNPVQRGLLGILNEMCGGPLIEATFYPLPLALAHRYAKSSYDYVRPRLIHARQLVGSDWSYNDIKRTFT